MVVEIVVATMWQYTSYDYIFNAISFRVYTIAFRFDLFHVCIHENLVTLPTVNNIATYDNNNKKQM